MAFEIFLDNWNRSSHPLIKEEFGKWSITLKSNDDGTPIIPHGSKYKVYCYYW